MRFIAVLVLGILAVSCGPSQLLLDLEKKPTVSPSASPTPTPVPNSKTIPAPTFSYPEGNYVSVPQLKVTNLPSGGEVLFTNNGTAPSFDQTGNPTGSTFVSIDGILWSSQLSGGGTFRAVNTVNGKVSAETDATYFGVGEWGPQSAWAGTGVQGGQITALAAGPSNVVFGGGTAGAMGFVGTVGPAGIVAQSIQITGVPGPATVTGIAYNQTSSILLVVGNLPAGGGTYSFGNSRTVASGTGTTGFIAVYSYPGLACQAVLTIPLTGTLTGIATTGSMAAVTGNFSGPAAATPMGGGQYLTLNRTLSNGVLFILSLSGGTPVCTAVQTSTQTTGGDWFNAVAVSGPPATPVVGVAGSTTSTVILGGSSLPISGPAKSPFYFFYTYPGGLFTPVPAALTNIAAYNGEGLAVTFDGAGNIQVGGYQIGSVAWDSFSATGSIGNSPGQNAMLFGTFDGNVARGVAAFTGATSGDSQITGLCYDANLGAFLVVGNLSAGTTGFGPYFTFPALTQPKPFIAQLDTNFNVQWFRTPDSAGAGMTYAAVAPAVADPTGLSTGLIPVAGTATGVSALSLGSGYQVTPAVAGNNPYFSWIFK